MLKDSNKNVFDEFDEIIKYTHFWNWAPDWIVAKKIYEKYENSFSVLTPFAYSYLEELIRSMTSEYGIELIDSNNKPMKRRLGISLINFAIDEDKNSHYEKVELLNECKKYFQISKSTDCGDNRNSTLHGYMHARFWTKESFENLIFLISKLSKYYQVK